MSTTSVPELVEGRELHIGSTKLARRRTANSLCIIYTHSFGIVCAGDHKSVRRGTAT